MPPRPRPPLSLTQAEQDLLPSVLDSERFADVAPATVFATLLDEGRYHGSIRTMYRLLAMQNQTGERRRQRVHPAYAKPELLAIRPCEVWSWDITKLKGPAKWQTFHLYVLLDIFSRYVVGWMIAAKECSEPAEQLIGDTIQKQNITPAVLRCMPIAAPACDRNPLPRCWSIWTSPNLTAVLTSRTTIPTLKRSSKRSSTGRFSRALRLDPGCARSLSELLHLV